MYIYLSYSSDVKRFADAARQAADSLQMIQAAQVSGADIWVGIYGVEDTPYMEAEFVAAEGVPRWVYLLHPDVAPPIDSSNAALRMFLDRLASSEVQIRYVHSPADLSDKIRFDLATQRPNPSPPIWRHVWLGAGLLVVGAGLVVAILAALLI